MRNLIVGVVAFLCLLAGTVNAQYAINTKGSAGVAVPVGTSTPVTIQDPQSGRCAWTWNWSETGDLMCEPIPVGTSSPAIAPDQTHGFKFSSNKSPWSSDAMTDDTTAGWQCVSTSGTLNIYTYGSQVCTKKGPNP